MLTARRNVRRLFPILIGGTRRAIPQGYRRLPADPMTGQTACPYGLIDPARLAEASRDWKLRPIDYESPACVLFGLLGHN
jgi:hypothetical protein